VFFLPLGTTRPHLRVPWVTYGLILVNIIVFAIQVRQPEPPPGTPVFGFVPAHPDLWAWFASNFIHGDVFHIGFNMLFLWLFGTLVEDVLGPWLFLACYFGGAIGATAVDWAVAAKWAQADLVVPRIGASGAIAGVMGLAAACFMRTKVRIVYVIFIRPAMGEIPAPVFLGLWVLQETWRGVSTTAAASGAGGGVAHWAHVGGFAVGLVGALVTGVRRRVARDDLLTGRARLEDTSGFFSQAGELERALLKAPEDAESWYALGSAQEMQGRLARAGDAYRKALELFLKQRNFTRAAAAYSAMKEYASPDDLPPQSLFDLACALEDTGHQFEAIAVFRVVADKHSGETVAETALIRGGELARRLGESEQAAHCFRRLLSQYPFSHWVNLAKEGLRALGLPETAPAPPPPTEDPDLGLLGRGE
jgi:membrane associated rhomboid family serine protease